MTELVEMLIVAAAREFVQTRPVMLFWSKSVFLAASAVAFNGGRR